MKQALTTILLILSHSFCTGQITPAGTLFQIRTKTNFFYVDFRETRSYVYEMGRYLDKGGSGNSIRNVDTLIPQTDQFYIGKITKVLEEHGKFYLIKESKKAKRFLLEPVHNIKIANSDLNNAWYLDNYFQMSEALNKKYPLSHHSFRNGFYSWETLNNKEEDFLTFREFATGRLQTIKDSISNLQNGYILKTNFILQNVSTLGYSILKDSLINLQANASSLSGYYAIIIKEVAKQNPGHFFQLAEDLPENRSMIFNAVEDEKEIVKLLEAVEGHDTIKKEFAKYRRFGKTMPYRILATYLVIGGLLTWLIVSQK